MDSIPQVRSDICGAGHVRSVEAILSEHEITRLVKLVAAIGEKLQVHEARDPGLEPLKKGVAPEHVLEHLNSAK